MWARRIIAPFTFGFLSCLSSQKESTKKALTKRALTLHRPQGMHFKLGASFIVLYPQLAATQSESNDFHCETFKLILRVISRSPFYISSVLLAY